MFAEHGDAADGMVATEDAGTSDGQWFAPWETDDWGTYRMLF